MAAGLTICNNRATLPEPVASPLVRIGLFLVVLDASSVVGAQGIVAPSIGAINRSMAGASTAAPTDAVGALHWNPASIRGLASSEVGVCLEFLYPSVSRVSSTLGANAVAPGVPPVSLSGSTDSDVTLFTLPTLAVVYRPEDSRWSGGIGVFTIGGVSTDLPADSSNPILSPPPPTGFGYGAVFARLQLLQIAPTIAYQVTDHIALGVAPTLTLADLQVDPYPFAAPDDANGDGFATYPSGTHSLLRFGGGVQAGIYYRGDGGFSAGFGIKSPQWFERFDFNSSDELGQNRELRLTFEYPMILSAGVAYSGFDRWLFSVDVRYIDYENAKPFEDDGFDASGALNGLGWDSTWFVGSGVAYRWTDTLTTRVGYSYNTNPIPDRYTAVNVFAPTVIFQHAVYAGLSFEIVRDWVASLSYYHTFENSIRGRFLTPSGSIPASSAKLESSIDAFLLGLNVRFGGHEKDASGTERSDEQ